MRRIAFRSMLFLSKLKPIKECYNVLQGKDNGKD